MPSRPSEPPPEDALAMSVTSLMTTNVATLGRDLTIEEAAQRMVDARVGGMPVVGEDGAVVGIVALSDLARSIDGRGHRRTVGDLMTTSLVTLAPRSTLREAARAMARHRVHRVLVVDDDERLVGIVSALDVIAAISA